MSTAARTSVIQSDPNNRRNSVFNLDQSDIVPVYEEGCNWPASFDNKTLYTNRYI